MLGVDLIGPFTKSRNGNSWCLTATNHFTKWVEAIPIKITETPPDVVEVVEPDQKAFEDHLQARTEKDVEVFDQVRLNMDPQLSELPRRYPIHQSQLSLDHTLDFYNRMSVSRHGTRLDGEALTLMFSLTVSIFAIAGLLGSLMVGMLVTRKGTVVNSTVLVFITGSLMGFRRICSSPEMVVFGRFVTGIHSVTNKPVCPLNERAAKNLRGFLWLVPSIFICAGVFSAQILRGALDPVPLAGGGTHLHPADAVAMVSGEPRYLLFEKHNVYATVTALKWYRAK
eukprot:XP_014056872.1 PREDICTED: solute carrier family 2, facilitated glucose transporter member 7-like [Salmo salar]